MDGERPEFCSGSIRKIQEVNKSFCKRQSVCFMSLNPDFLLHSLLTKYPSFSDIKFMPLSSKVLHYDYTNAMKNSWRFIGHCNDPQDIIFSHHCILDSGLSQGYVLQGQDDDFIEITVTFDERNRLDIKG